MQRGLTEKEAYEILLVTLEMLRSIWRDTTMGMDRRTHTEYIIGERVERAIKLLESATKE